MTYNNKIHFLNNNMKNLIKALVNIKKKQI